DHRQDRVAALRDGAHGRERQGGAGLDAQLRVDKRRQAALPGDGDRERDLGRRLLMRMRLLHVVLALLALGLSLAAPGEGAPRLQLASATGSLELSNSKAGAALFTAAGMRPGDEASGSVTIGNTGTVGAALSV